MRQLLESRRVTILVAVLVVVLLGICVMAALPKGGGSSSQPTPDQAEVLPEDDPANQVNPQQTPDSSFLYDTSIAALMTADSYMDGQTVQVVGEAVGDRIRAEDSSDHCWISLQSLSSPNDTVFVYMTQTLAQNIDTYGAYGRQGTTLQVRGTFSLACADHEGLSDLHADHAAVVHKGVVEPDPFKPLDFVPGLVLLLLAGGLFFLFWRVREGNR